MTVTTRERALIEARTKLRQAQHRFKALNGRFVDKQTFANLAMESLADLMYVLDVLLHIEEGDQ